MIIKIFPRQFFLNIKGTIEEDLIFKRYNVISINTPVYPPRSINFEEPPFSKKYCGYENVLILYFHDCEIQLDQVKLITDEDVDKIFNFVQEMDKSKGLFVHCTAGISRSGAVGYVLNEYFNRFLQQDKNENEDYDRFTQYYKNKIIPNSLVKTKLMKKFGMI